MLNKFGNVGYKIGTVLLCILTLSIIVIALLGIAGIGFGYLLSNCVFGWVTTNLGLDYHAANFATAVIVFLIWTVAPGLMWKFWLQKRRMWNGLAVVAFYGVVWALISTVGGNVCFDRRTGKPLCYFVDTAAGRKWSRTAGFDPSSGKEFRLYTREIKEAEEGAGTSESQSHKETSRFNAGTSTPNFPAVSVKSQMPSLSESENAKNQNPERRGAVKLFSETSKTVRHQSETKAAAGIADERKPETETTIEPVEYSQPTQVSSRHTIVDSQTPVSTSDEKPEIEQPQKRRENSDSNPADSNRNKKNDRLKKELKNSSLLLANYGLEKLNRKIH